ncbi:MULTISPECIES: formate dehydrogenase subunit gamma [Acidiphilium]|uniref:Formate dehydrogenase gamma subunit n=1 Tax=Acidiphilium rubrum TaxID=526 RepID=A0A8G2CNI0_ACIRU|nr:MULTISPECIES: formate dehydrogenase subunit gamma [Acidiphilium]SIR44490.1 formate dehydrogenase gamma subunit [Acidiphilium rubrum]
MAKQHSVWNATDAREIIAAEQHREGAMLPILHALQAAFGYIPRDAEPLIAEALNLSRAEVHGVISFYHDFRREPAGRHVLKLCRAEACQSMGSEVTAQRLLDLLGLDWGETSPDGRITIEPVYCLGLCATAPSALFDDEPIGRADQQMLETLVMEAA